MTTSLQKAIAAHQSGNLDAAELLYHDALAAAPQNAEAHYNLGLLYGQQNRPADAVREFSTAIEARPDFGDAWFMLCDFADQLGHHKLSCFAGEHAVRLKPHFARAWLRYGIALSRLGKNRDAIAAYRRALELDAGLSGAWINLGVAYMNEGLPAEAEAAAHKGLESAKLAIADEGTREIDESEYSLPHWHLALAELAQGKYREGFAHLRARYKGSTDWKRFNDPHPLWKGEDLAGKTILVRVEQGHGDALMFCRYVPMLKARGAKVIFQVHPALARLFENWPGADVVLSMNETVAIPFDCHTTIFDLPYRFATAFETIPADIPYLPRPEPDNKTRIAGQGLKIGLVWAGQIHPAHDRLRSRSVPLSAMTGLFDIQGIRFFSLTTDKRGGDAEILARYPVTDMASVIGDFADTARIVTQLDLVITCDTAAAHLAGGMGVPVWTMLALAPDWRWLTDGERCPWYPSMRLFRQTRKDDWAGVIANIRTGLHDVEKKADKAW